MIEETYKCQLCGDLFDGYEMYSYRGFLFCQDHHEEGIKRVDEKRALVMEITEHSVSSQRKGEFMNNHHKYNINNISGDGLPIMSVNEPEILKEYEKGIL